MHRVSRLADAPVMRLDVGGGKWLELPATCLLVFLDETGENSYSDPHYPLFGIGGCVVTVGQYEQFVKVPWKGMMRKSFGGPDQIFHSTDYAGGRGTPDQYGALTQYFTKFPIGRIASVITNLAAREVDIDTYRLVAASLFERFRQVARVFEFTEVAVIVESSSHYDWFAEQYLFSGRDSLQVSIGDVEHEMVLRKFFLSKSSGECGLQVADAIVNTAGGQARARLKGASEPRNRDFLAVFKDLVDSRWSSYLEITRATDAQ